MKNTAKLSTIAALLFGASLATAVAATPDQSAKAMPAAGDDFMSCHLKTSGGWDRYGSMQIEGNTLRVIYEEGTNVILDYSVTDNKDHMASLEKSARAAVNGWCNNGDDTNPGRYSL